MSSSVTALLLMMGLAIACSLPNKQTVMEKKTMVIRREAEPGNQTNVTDDQTNVTNNLTGVYVELANLSIPYYLRELYINLTYLNKDNPLNDEKINTIRTYENQAENAKCGYVKFNMNNNSVGEEEIIRAELHLLQNNLTGLPSHYNIDIFYLLNENDTESPLKHSFNHIHSTPGWKKFDITPLVLLWKKNWLNHGLQIRLTKGEKILPCQGVFAEGQDSKDAYDQPILVVLTHDRNSKFLKNILKPMANHIPTQQQKRNTINVENLSCHRKEMIVTADSLNSTDTLILYPKEIDVGICEGHCKRLQPAPNNDHAYILSLYYRNNVDLSEVPSKCCVPTSYEKIHMIFYNRASHEHIFKIDVAVKAKKCICL